MYMYVKELPPLYLYTLEYTLHAGREVPTDREHTTLSISGVVLLPFQPSVHVLMSDSDTFQSSIKLICNVVSSWAWNFGYTVYFSMPHIPVWKSLYLEDVPRNFLPLFTFPRRRVKCYLTT